MDLFKQRFDAYFQINTSTCEVSEDAFTVDSFYPFYKSLSLHTEKTLNTKLRTIWH